MIRTVELLAGYSKRAFLEWMGFRSFLVTLVVNQAVAPLLGLAIWSAALPGQADISTYFVALLAVQLMTVSQEYYSVTMRIYEGALTEDLLRPHPLVIMPLGESIAFRSWNFLMGIPIVAMAMILTGVSFQIMDVIVAIPSIVFAAILSFLFVYMLALSALWVEQAGAVTDLGGTLIFLLGGVAVPIMFFPDRIRPWGEALPFRSMIGFPAEIASGSLSTSQIVQGYCWQVLWVAVAIPLAMFVWQTGIRRFTAVGG
jgi:ABC-2 type transport system permease protein